MTLAPPKPRKCPPDTPHFEGVNLDTFLDRVYECPGPKQDRESSPHQRFTLGCPERPTTTERQLPRHVRVSRGLYRPRTDTTLSDDRSRRGANRISERVGTKSGGSLPKQLEPLPGSLCTEIKRCGKVAERKLAMAIRREISRIIEESKAKL